MKILMIGSGGREHALIKKLKESDKCTKLYCAPGNGGIAKDAECVNIGAMDTENMVKFAKDNAIDLVLQKILFKINCIHKVRILNICL